MMILGHLRFLITFLLLWVFMMPAAHAETVNVKVSGSLDIYTFYRSNFDLLDGNDAGVVALDSTVPAGDHDGSAAQRSDADDFFLSIAQVAVSADLSDQVSTMINVINQRDWNAGQFDSGDSNLTNEFDLVLDLAYVQMAGIFYTPLTLTVGRQDIMFGRGFIIGGNYLNPNGVQASEYTTLTAFDAVKATLDFDPWTLDIAYTKITENAHNPEDDRDMYLVNIHYAFSELNAVAEAYYFGEVDRASQNGLQGLSQESADIHTVGTRLQFDPIEALTLGGEIAYQFGDYFASSGGEKRDRAAWAANLFAEYRFESDWKPKVNVEYAYFSGEEDLTSTSQETYRSWSSAYRYIAYGYVHDDLESYYATAQGNDPAYSENQQVLSVSSSLTPLPDLQLVLSYYVFWTTADTHTDRADLASPFASSDIGYEIDFTITYAYTEDVTFSCTGGWFVPGDLYTPPNDATAAEIVNSLTVKF